MNCKLVEREGTYIVVENETDFELGSWKSIKEARKWLRFYNYGGGFDGFTPNFMKK